MRQSLLITLNGEAKSNLVGRIVEKSHITKGMDMIFVSDIYINTLGANPCRHKCYEEFPDEKYYGVTAYGLCEIRRILVSMKLLFVKMRVMEGSKFYLSFLILQEMIFTFQGMKLLIGAIKTSLVSFS